jgi:hypothetical protein
MSYRLNFPWRSDHEGLTGAGEAAAPGEGGKTGRELQIRA